MDRKLAYQTIQWCDQLEQALLDDDEGTIEALRAKLISYFAKADEGEIRVAIECARARANEVLQEED